MFYVNYFLNIILITLEICFKIVVIFYYILYIFARACYNLYSRMADVDSLHDMSSDLDQDPSAVEADAEDDEVLNDRLTLVYQ